MSCGVCFSWRSLQMRQEKREDSVSRSAAITYLSSTNGSGCCPRDCTLWHVFTGAAHCLCLCCCSAAAPPPTVPPHGYRLRLKLFQPFLFFSLQMNPPEPVCMSVEYWQTVWLAVYKTRGAFRCAVALSGSGYKLHCRVYAHSHTLLFMLLSFGFISLFCWHWYWT